MVLRCHLCHRCRGSWQGLCDHMLREHGVSCLQHLAPVPSDTRKLHLPPPPSTTPFNQPSTSPPTQAPLTSTVHASVFTPVAASASALTSALRSDPISASIPASISASIHETTTTTHYNRPPADVVTPMDSCPASSTLMHTPSIPTTTTTTAPPTPILHACRPDEHPSEGFVNRWLPQVESCLAQNEAESLFELIGHISTDWLQSARQIEKEEYRDRRAHKRPLPRHESVRR